MGNTRNPNGQFSAKDAKIIAKNARNQFRRPLNQPAQPRYPIGSGGGGGFLARITDTNDTTNNRYSWVGVTFNSDGTTTDDTSNVGSRSDATGFAMEYHRLRYVPLNTIVFLTPSPGQDYFSFQFKHALNCQTTSPTTGSYPTSPNVYFPMVIRTISGTQAVGGTATVTVGTEKIIAYNTGTSVPALGAVFIVSQTNPGYFVFSSNL